MVAVVFFAFRKSTRATATELVDCVGIFCLGLLVALKEEAFYETIRVNLMVLVA